VPRIKAVSSIAIGGPNRWGIDGVISGLSLLWGNAGTGKSFVAVSMGVSIATGRPWLGRRTKEGPVIYIAGEGGEEGVAHRVRAALKEWTVDLDDHSEQVPFFVVTPGVDLVEGGGELLDLVGEKTDVRLIVVDTLSRCFVGDENKQEFMGKFVRTLDYLRDHYRCDILVIHHANKQRELRGSSVLFGAVDVSWHLTQSRERNKVAGEKDLFMRADKLRERPSEGATLQFRATPRTLVGPHGRTVLDEFGDEGTTLVIKPTKKDLESAARIRDKGLEMIKDKHSVHYTAWRAEFPTLSKAEFDNALSFVVTFPGHWGIMRDDRVGTYTKAVRGVENHWSSLA